MPDGYGRQPDLRDLRQQRARHVDAMRKAMENAEREDRDLSAIENAQHQSSYADVMRLNDEIARAERAKDLERLEAGRAGAALAGRGGGPDGSFERMCLDFSLRKAILSLVPDARDAVDTGLEREVSTEIQRRSGRPAAGICCPPQIFWKPVEQRVVTTGAPSLGANLIGVQHRPDLYINKLYDKIFLTQVGGTIISDLTAPVDIPRMDQGGTAYWFAENSNITPADPVMGSVPLTMHHVAMLSSYSLNLLLGASPSVEQVLREDFARQLAEAINEAVLVGAGGVEPAGLLGQAGLPKVVGTGGIAWDLVVDLVTKCQVNNSEAVAWVTNPAVVGQARKTPKRTGATDSAMVMDEAADTLIGRPVVSTNVCPVTAIVAGDWSSAMLGLFGGLSLLSNPYELGAYQTGNVWLRAIQTCDINFRHLASFCAAVDLPVPTP